VAVTVAAWLVSGAVRGRALAATPEFMDAAGCWGPGLGAMPMRLDEVKRPMPGAVSRGPHAGPPQLKTRNISKSPEVSAKINRKDSRGLTASLTQLNNWKRYI